MSFQSETLAEKMIATDLSVEGPTPKSDDSHMGVGMKNQTKRIIAVMGSTLALVIVIGQACAGNGLSGLGQPAGISGNGGGYGGMKAPPMTGNGQQSDNGNGGGYGGMVSQTGGSYGGGAETESAMPRAAMGIERMASLYLFGPEITEGGCAKFPARLRAVGPFVHGMIHFDFSGEATHHTSACERGKRIDADKISSVDFDDRVALFADDIYVRIRRLVPRLRDVVQPVAYCANARSDGRRDIGLTVFIFKQGEKTLGTIIEGKKVGQHYMRFVVKPFEVTSQITDGQVEFSKDSFNLSVARNGQKKTVGHLGVELNGAPVDSGMVCHLSAP